MNSVCLAILNYNGVHHLKELLPSVGPASESYKGKIETVVLDNCSTQQDKEWVQKNHPWASFVSAPKNEYMFSYNWLAENRRENTIIFLNNDTRLTRGFFEKVTRHFNANDLFSVCASSLSWDGSEITCGPAHLNRHKGFYRWGYDCSRQLLSHTLFSSSGFMAVDRLKFLEIGGFSRLYFPMYCDDLDLGFRAWRKGWRSIFDPEAVVYHRENGSGASEWVQWHGLRNSLLFEWSSLPTREFAWQRGPRIIKLILRELLAGKTFWFTAWWGARRIWAKEKKNYPETKITEAEYQKLVARLKCPVPQ